MTAVSSPRSLDAWEDALQRVLSSVDRALEKRHGGKWTLHPARPEAGVAANPQYDGLFRVTAAFSAGFGSKLGPGYLLRAEIATLAPVHQSDRAAIEEEAVALVREGLAREFPGKALAVDKDGDVWKIHGDLSL